MPVYYDVALPITSNANAGVESTVVHLLMRNGGFITSMVKGAYINAQSGTAGGGKLKANTYGTNAASCNGSAAVVPAPRNPNSPAAITSAQSSNNSKGTGATLRFSVGLAQTGGMGGWVAIEPDAAIQLISTGSYTSSNTKGNIEFTTLMNAASVPVDLTVEFSEL